MKDIKTAEERKFPYRSKQEYFDNVKPNKYLSIYNSYNIHNNKIRNERRRKNI